MLIACFQASLLSRPHSQPEDGVSWTEWAQRENTDVISLPEKSGSTQYRGI